MNPRYSVQIAGTTRNTSDQREGRGDERHGPAPAEQIAPGVASPGAILDDDGVSHAAASLVTVRGASSRQDVAPVTASAPTMPSSADW